MCHVLVIEDDWLIAEHIVHLAEEAGATSIAQADTQAGAIEAARGQRPEMILSDVKLLSGTGPLAVQEILAELGEIPVIFITGTPEDCAPCAPPGIVLSSRSSIVTCAKHSGVFHRMPFSSQHAACLRLGPPRQSWVLPATCSLRERRKVQDL